VVNVSYFKKVRQDPTKARASMLPLLGVTGLVAVSNAILYYFYTEMEKHIYPLSGTLVVINTMPNQLASIQNQQASSSASFSVPDPNPK